MDKKGIKAVLREIAEKHPEQYREISKRLSDVGRDAAYTTGGSSFGLRHLRPTPSVHMSRQRLNRRIRDILSHDNWSDDTKEGKVIEATAVEHERLTHEILEEAKKSGNPLADQVVSGARGKPANLKRLIGGDMLYVDHHENVIPFPVQTSFSEGLSPAEFWASSYGARKGLIDVKLATQDAGFFCLAKGTLVRMADWTTNVIEDIQIGDLVLGADINGRTFPVPVTRTFTNGVRPLKRFRFRYGKSRKRFLEIVATTQHRALCEHLRRRRRRPAKQLRIEITRAAAALGEFERRAISWYALLPPQGYAHVGGKREPWAGMLGFLIAEGGLTTNHIGMSCGDAELLTAICAHVAQFDFEVRRKRNSQYEFRIIDQQPLTPAGRPGGGLVTGTFMHRLKKRLHQWGILGKTSPYKRIPVEVDTWDNTSIALLLQWLFAGDGGVAPCNNSTTPVVTLGMTADIVVRKTQQLLADRFGIYGQISVAKTAGKPCGVPEKKYMSRHDTTVLAISDRTSLLRFAEHIGFVAGAKQKRLMRLLTAADPAERRDQFMFHYVTSEDVGADATFDIEVGHPDHLFVLANGAIVSNSKQLNQLAHRLIVTGTDADEDAGEGAPLRGLPVDVTDADSEGALLAAPVGDYSRNTTLTPKILRDLENQGVKRILVRSPTVGGPAHGVYGRDVGVRERGSVSSPGDMVGIAAAQALSEKLTQGQLSSKHSGGVKGEAQAVTGFQHVNQLVQVPKTFKGGAAHAQLDGRVTAVEEAPAGGRYVTISGERHFVLPGFDLKVARGDDVEAGDVISEGIPNPSEIVKYKGIGEGRRYFMNTFADAYRAGGMYANRRNIELLARGLIDHVEMVDESDNHVPGDVVPYQQLEANWQPRDGSRPVRPKQAVGRYLERPVLHYTIGTRVTPSMLPLFDEFGVNELEVHDEEPPFKPLMVRAMASVGHDPDWMTRFLGSNQKKSLLSATHRGAVSDTNSTSFVPAMAAGTEFGRSWPQNVLRPPKT